MMRKNTSKMLKRLSALTLALLMVFALAACGQSNPTSSTDPGKTDTPKKETITLIYASADTSSDNKNAVVAEAWMDEVERISEGRIKFDRVYDGQAATFDDMVESVKTGIVDIGHMMASTYGDAYPLNELFLIPLLTKHPDYLANSKAYVEMMEKYPAIREEFTNQGVMFLNACPSAGQAFAFSAKSGAVTSVADLKGKIITCFNSIDPIFLSALGAVPDLSSPTEIYDSMTKGILDGTLISYTGGTALNVVEGTKYVLTTPYMNGIGRFNLIMNPAAYEKVPDDLKYLFEPEFQNYIGELYSYQFMMDELGYEQIWRDSDIEFYDMTEEEMQDMMPGTEILCQQWIEKVNALGYDGQTMLDEWVSLVEKYQNEIDINNLDYRDTLTQWLGKDMPSHWPAEY